MSPRIFSTLCLALSGALLSGAFALQSNWLVAGLTVAITLFWFGAQWRNWAWLSSLLFFLMVAATVIGIFSGLATLVALLNMALLIMAWESGRFGRLLAGVERVDNKQQLVAAHRQRLLIVVGTGLVLGSAATVVRIRFGFAVALPLACISVVGFSLAINFMRRFAH